MHSLIVNRRKFSHETQFSYITSVLSSVQLLSGPAGCKSYLPLVYTRPSHINCACCRIIARWSFTNTPTARRSIALGRLYAARRELLIGRRRLSRRNHLHCS